MALRKFASQFACSSGLRVCVSPALSACRESLWRGFATGAARSASCINGSQPACRPVHLRHQCYPMPACSASLQWTGWCLHAPVRVLGTAAHPGA
jgi:hypothetical protein